MLQIIKSKFQTDHHEKEVSTISFDEIDQNISKDKALDLENSERSKSGAENHEFACSICDQAFDNQLAFENHIEIHQKYGGKKENSPAFENEYYYYVGSDSETCEENNDQNSQLITNDSMEKSKDDSHDQEIIEIDKETIKLTPKENFVCKTCGKMFSRRGTLKRHEKIHPGEKPFHCDTCDKRFMHLHHLKCHKSVHTGEKPFQCKVCNTMFTLFQSMKEHERIHTGKNLYQCDTCDKRFTKSTLLKIHERTHTGEKPYGCKSCDKRFSQKSALNQHERIHTAQ